MLTFDEAPDKLVSFQRLVVACPNGDGADCFFEDEVHLLFHKKFGNWHAWRFALIFNNISMKSTNKLILNASKVDIQRAELAKLISQSEKDFVKTMTHNLDFGSDTSQVWLQIRENFKFGVDQKYPTEMLRYHYKTVGEAYFKCQETTPT